MRLEVSFVRCRRGVMVSFVGEMHGCESNLFSSKWGLRIDAIPAELPFQFKKINLFLSQKM